MIYLQDEVGITHIRQACKINATVHQAVAQLLSKGVTTAELDEKATETITACGAQSSFREEFNYPGSICVSVNDEIGHGVPGPRKLEDGDVVKIDVGVFHDGYHSDCAKTYIVGAGDWPKKRHLLTATREALLRGLAVTQPGRHLSDISHAIGQTIRQAGLSVVKKAHGHGIGQYLHEDPQIPNYGPAGRGPRLRPGMVLAIEPVVVDGNETTTLKEDGWTEVTLDGSIGAHFEHTVLVTDTGVEVLTMANQGEAITQRLFKAHGLRWRQKQDGDENRMVFLAKKEMDSILLDAWGRPVHPSEILHAPSSTTYVLVDERNIVWGFCVFSFRRPYLHLNTLVLDSSLHGNGVARLVMELLDVEAEKFGMCGVELWVQTNNERAVRFYNKLGFRYTGTPYFRTWSMRKRLTELTTGG